MPIECEFDSQLHAIVIRAIGRVNMSDFMRGIDQFLEFPEFEPGLNQLVDCSAAELDLQEAESRDLARFFQSAPVREKLGSHYKLAMVADRAVDFGVLRMYEVHEENDPISIRVFYSLKEKGSGWRNAPRARTRFYGSTRQSFALPRTLLRRGYAGTEVRGRASLCRAHS